MNAKTKEAVKRHGESLLAAFPNATERDPIALCKKLRRIETSLAKPIQEFNANGKNEPELERQIIKARARVCELLSLDAVAEKNCGLFIDRQSEFAITIRTFGILAPDLNQ
jgi:hypothetical protein